MRKFRAGTKRVLMVSVLALLLVGFLCTYFGLAGRRDGVGTVDAQIPDNRAVAETAVPRDAPPFETAKAFWDLSRKGDLQAIDAVITKIPASYWVRCEETPSSLAFKERRAKMNAGLPKLGSLRADGKDFNVREDLELKSIGLLKRSAELNKESQFQGLELVDQKVYGDEALVIAKYRITDKNYGHPVYYMTRSDGVWRIFLSNSRDFPFEDADDYYGSQRPKCADI